MTPNDPLSDLLRSWEEPRREADRSFGPAVWKRIKAHESENSGFWGFAGRLTRPLAATAALAASLALGSGAAFAYDALTANDRLASQYAQSIDPLQMHVQEHPPL